MQETPDILIVINFVLWLLVGWGVSWLIWAFLIGPKVIRKGIKARHTPMEIHSGYYGAGKSMVTSFVTSLLPGAVTGFFSWRWASVWLEEGIGGLKFDLAEALSETRVTKFFEDAEGGFDRFIPVVVVIAGIVGFTLGMYLGIRYGYRFAANRFALTKNSF